jgi:signal transduction histidine kinase
VLFALLENALKFSPAGAVVSIGLEVSALHYRLSVCDRGPGVPAAERETIFERYAHTQAPGTQRGTGLGLAIARALVESWNGTIAVDDGPSGGARFFYDVPRAAAGREAHGPLQPVSG